MGMTMTQKILAAHAGKECLAAGELIEARLDLVLGNDVTTPVAITEFENAGFTKVFDKDKIAIVIMADMDHLKEINDTFGHNEGDSAIRTSANILRGVLGKNGALGRAPLVCDVRSLFSRFDRLVALGDGDAQSLGARSVQRRLALGSINVLGEGNGVEVPERIVNAPGAVCAHRILGFALKGEVCPVQTVGRRIVDRGVELRLGMAQKRVVHYPRQCAFRHGFVALHQSRCAHFDASLILSTKIA